MYYDKNAFLLNSSFSPSGDQPTAIGQLVQGLDDGLSYQTLLGVTGSGKTYTMAQIIAQSNRPALIIGPNKTLCAQLYAEFKEFFPNAAVEYFVSYFDYFQPETYIAHIDKYIEKDSMVNEYLQSMRLSATKSIMSRSDTIIVASVSAIYGLGEVLEIRDHAITFKVAMKLNVQDAIKQLIKAQYKIIKPEQLLTPGTLKRVGDVLTIMPAESQEYAIRVEWFDDMVEKVTKLHPITAKKIENLHQYSVFPATHYVVGDEAKESTLDAIRRELDERVSHFERIGKPLEAYRIAQRTKFDLEMMEELGYCKGIENYSRHLSGRKPGQPPATLLDYLPDNAIIFFDESHTAIPQFRAMYAGDKSRKEVLIENGFRLPSAYDARPLKFEEAEAKFKQVIFVSATPSEYELEKSNGEVAEQVIRPTGIVDPEIEVRPASTQVDDSMDQISNRVKNGDRVLVTVLTKELAERLAEWYLSHGIRAKYIHGNVEATDRVEILRGLRQGDFDVLVGINLLREGLDLPEVSLVMIMDADKEGFLRNSRSLIQTIGRAARNINGHVILYADKVTASMTAAINETNRRRKKQQDFNAANGIVPKNARNKIKDIIERATEQAEKDPELMEMSLRELKKEMKEAAKNLEFEKAAKFRDRINELNRQIVGHIN